jgi:hypothetical protein
LQSQFDNHFLITSSPGAVAEYLNTVVDLQVIDDSIDRVNKRLKNTKTDIKQKEKLIKEYTDGIKEFEYIDDLSNDVNVLNQLQDEVNKQEVIHDDILTLIERLEELQVEKDKEKDYKQGVIDADLIYSYVVELNNLLDLHGNLSWLISDYNIDSLNLEKNKKYKKALKEITIIENNLNELKENQKVYNDIFELTQHIESLQLDGIAIDKELKILQQEYDKYRTDECPLCGRSCDCKENK